MNNPSQNPARHISHMTKSSISKRVHVSPNPRLPSHPYHVPRIPNRHPHLPPVIPALSIKQPRQTNQQTSEYTIRPSIHHPKPHRLLPNTRPKIIYPYISNPTSSSHPNNTAPPPNHTPLRDPPPRPHTSPRANTTIPDESGRGTSKQQEDDVGREHTRRVGTSWSRTGHGRSCVAVRLGDGGRNVLVCSERGRSGRKGADKRVCGMLDPSRPADAQPWRRSISIPLCSALASDLSGLSSLIASLSLARVV